MFFGGQGSRIRKDPHIFKANMDGSNVTKIVSNKTISPRSLAVDPYLERIYWYDSSLEQIWTADYNGNQKRILARGVYVSIKNPVMTMSSTYLKLMGKRNTIIAISQQW